MVKWEVFRPKTGLGAPDSLYGHAQYYGSNQARLLERVSEGGTLWLITSRRKGRDQRTHHLAYKLTNCVAVEAHKPWKYVVRASGSAQSRHFGYNEATEQLKRLQFTSGRPMCETERIGLRLLSIPALTVEDVRVLEGLQHRIENGRAVFISYCRSDEPFASMLESELGVRDISTSRDVVLLKPGQEWEAALEQEVKCTDCFLVLVSPQAAESEWVRTEVKWAIREYDNSGLVKTILPVVLPSGGWEKFPELHRFQRWVYPVLNAQKEPFDKLAGGVVLTDRARSHGM